MKRLTDNPGVYYIKNLITQQMYVGSSTFIGYRFCRHKSNLRFGKCHNQHLQNSFSKYKEINFEFGVLLVCDIPDIRYYEEQLINYYMQIGYSLFNKTTTTAGPYQKKWTSEEKADILERHDSGESIISLSSSLDISQGVISKLLKQNGRITNKTWVCSKEQIQEIKNLHVNGKTLLDIAKALGFSSYAPIVRIMKENNISTYSPRRKIMSKTVQKKIRVWRKTKTIKEIAKMLNTSTAQVQRFCKKEGLCQRIPKKIQ